MKTTGLFKGWLVLCLCLWGSSPAHAAAEATAAQAFERLRSLVGVWEGTFSNGRVHTITYRMTAGDTVLVETWALAPGHETMTLYHLDGPALIATHYCAAGNQPTLQLAAATNPDQLRFEFRSGTNLPEPAAKHQHRFEFRLLGRDRYWRSGTYREGSKEETEAVTYARKSAAADIAPWTEAKQRMQCGDTSCLIETEYCVQEFFAAAQPARYSCRKLPLPECGNQATAGTCRGDAKSGYILEVVYP